MSFVPTFWNTKTQYNQSNRVSKISGGQIAYKKRGYAWDYVDNSILSDLTNSSFPGSVQFPTNAQGWADIHFDGEYSAKRQVVENNWQSSEDEFVMRIRADCPTNSVGIIDGAKPWQVKYSNAFGQGAHLIYGIWQGKTSRFEHVIEITEMPVGDSEFLTYDFFIESTDATTFVGANHDTRPWAGSPGDGATVEGFSVFLAKGNDPSTSRGAVLRTPVCWWTNLDGTLTRKNVRVDFEIQPDGETVKATKYVRRTDIAEALAQGSAYRADVTFNPDPNPETSSFDGVGSLTTQNSSWSALIAKLTSGADDFSAFQNVIQIRGDATTNQWDDLSRSFFLFDTSSIGGGEQVDTASFSIKVNKTDTSSNFGTSWNVYSSAPASNTALAGGDFDSLGTTPFSTARDLSSEAASYTGVTFTLNTDGKNNVDVAGVSKFGLALQEDRENGTHGDPTWSTGLTLLQAYMTEAPVTDAEKPLLTVTHSAAPAAGFLPQNNNSIFGNR